MLSMGCLPSLDAIGISPASAQHHGASCVSLESLNICGLTKTIYDMNIQKQKAIS